MSGVLTSGRVLEDSVFGSDLREEGFLLSESPAFEASGAGPLDEPVDRYGAVRQYSLAKIVGVWAAAALPMGFLAWTCVPLLRDQLGGRDPFIESLLICLNVGLLWTLALTLILLRREQGGLEWSRVVDGLWLRSPRSPNREDRRHGLAVGNSVRPALRSDQCPADRPRRLVAEGPSRPTSEGSGPS